MVIKKTLCMCWGREIRRGKGTKGGAVLHSLLEHFGICASVPIPLLAEEVGSQI